MSLSKSSYLYKVHVLFDMDGTLSLVETIHRDLIADDGKIISNVERQAKSYPAGDLTPSVKALLGDIERVAAEMEAKRLADEAEAEAKRAADAAAAKETAAKAASDIRDALSKT